MKRLNGFIHQSFKKVRVGVKGDKKPDEMYNRRRYLRTKDDNEIIKELEKLEDYLADKYSESMFKKIKEELKVMNGDEGGYNPGHLWKLRKKLSLQQFDPPTTMQDTKGKILWDDKDIINEAVRHFKTVFASKPTDSELKDHEDQIERLCKRRLQEALTNKTPEWTLDDVKNAIKSLNSGILKDLSGHPNEIFQEGTAWEGLWKAILKLLNILK